MCSSAPGTMNPRRRAGPSARPSSSEWPTPSGPRSLTGARAWTGSRRRSVALVVDVGGDRHLVHGPVHRVVHAVDVVLVAGRIEAAGVLAIQLVAGRIGRALD